jgi:hypothetical protein
MLQTIKAATSHCGLDATVPHCSLPVSGRWVFWAQEQGCAFALPSQGLASAHCPTLWRSSPGCFCLPIQSLSSSFRQSVCTSHTAVEMTWSLIFYFISRLLSTH